MNIVSPSAIRNRFLSRSSLLRTPIVYICIVYIVLFLAHALLLQKAVYGDGLYYFSILRSLVVDHDIQFTNEYAFFSISQPLTLLGVPGNKYSIGPALLWLPNYLATYSIFGGTGYEFLYQLITGITSVLAVITGLILLGNSLLSHYNKSVSTFVLLSLAFASHLLFYGSVDPIHSHSAAFFANAVFVALLTASTKYWCILGISLAYVGMIRPQDMVIGLLLLPFIQNPRSLVRLLIGTSIGLLPQLAMWQILNGTFWMSPYLGNGEGFIWPPHILEVLFHPEYGILLWTPIVGIAITGLWLKNTTIGISKYILLAYICLSVLIVSAWSTWWQGATFSGRMFISLLPVLSFGLANWYALIERRYSFLTQFVPLVVAALTILNCLLVLWYLLTH